MNTPAHAIVNLLLFGKQHRERHALVIVIGALLPDLSMLLFYIQAKWRHLSEQEIWRDSYFSEAWQASFDTFHSFPLIGLAFLLAWRMQKPLWMLFFASMFVHSCFDFPLHHNDAHHHFFPFSMWQFHSPVSYWNPQYYGQIAAMIELFSVLVGGAWMLHTGKSPALRKSVGFILLFYLSVWGLSIWWWQ
ncbi:MAG: hypothetical protein R8K53_06295 [Mariprofundaceae bacterium]